MIHKRPYVDDDSYEFACKHPRPLDYIDQVTQVATHVPLQDAHLKPTISEGLDNFHKCENAGKTADDPVVAISNETHTFESGTSGSFPHFLWINNGILEVENLSLFPEFFEHGNQLKAFLHPDEPYSPLDYPFRKPVSIGPEHQVIVPDWEGSHTSSTRHASNSEVVPAQASSSSSKADDDYEERLMGTCVIPMPKVEVPPIHGCEGVEVDCGCLEQGSIACVKQHIMGARQKLRDNLGEDTFERLGFYDMGECVAKKWSEEEEQLFHDVVAANPASSGKNFWNQLSVAFPSRRKGEIISYYFNVFMLRKRAKQNRFDPLNIDSDDDEWERSEDGVIEKDDEDSAVESPNGEEADAYYEEHMNGCTEHIADEDEPVVFKESGDDEVQKVGTDEEYEGDLDDVSAVHVGCGGETGFKLSKGIPMNNGNDCEVEDDSCTSYEYQRDSGECGGPFDIATNGTHSSRE